MNSGHDKRNGKSGAKSWWRRKESVLITDAKVSPGQDRHRREIGYGILQFLRVPALFLTVWLIYAHQAWVAAAIISAITIPLPWIAVVFANAKGNQNDKRDRNTYKPAIARQARQQQALADGDYQQLEFKDSPRRESDIIDHIDPDGPTRPQ